MTDIVKRLRELATTKYHGLDKMWQGMRDAADEIERLREENKFLRHLVADELRALEPKP